MNEYRAVAGMLNDHDAQTLGETLEELAQSGPVTPDVIVEAARAETSKIHSYFLWDDSAAAERYRQVQARYYLRTITVVRGKGEVRAFQNVVVRREPQADQKPDPGVRGYVTLDQTMASPELMAQVVEHARQELVSWKRRYAEYQDLAEQCAIVQNAIRSFAVEVV